MNKKRRGIFIVFEGLDRCGKTTQVNKTLEFFKKSNLPVKEFVFPDRSTEIGKQIDDFNKKKKKLKDEVIHLLYTANRWEKSDSILETLDGGTNIVCSRYSYSGVAYSSAKKGMTLEWCKNPEVGLPEPDIVIYLKIKKSEKLKERKGFGDEIYEKESFLNKVKDQYEIIISSEEKGLWTVIDASQSIDMVWKEVSNCIKEKLKGKLKDVKKLWLKK